ncbi:MAG: CYCXC family (seleno)protein [Terriglobales bacterium]
MSRKERHKGERWKGLGLIVAFVVLSIVLCGFVLYGTFRRQPGKPAQNQSQLPTPPYFTVAQATQALPTTLDPERFTRPAVMRAYRVAKEIPQVLAQQPCYCGCDRHGHRSLLDCFVTDHAATCNICLKEALLAGRMHRGGQSAAEVRAAIIREDWRSVSLQ